MVKAERVVQLRLGEKVVVQAVPFPIPEKAGRREDQEPAFKQLEKFVGLHWDKIQHLRGGKFEDETDLATEPDTFPLVEMLKQFEVTPEDVRCATKRILTRNLGLSTRDAGLHAQAFSDFLERFER